MSQTGSSNYEADIVAGQGFHPNLKLTIHLEPDESSQRLNEQGCSLWTHLNISPSFIVDRYQWSGLHREGRLGSLDTASSSSLNVIGEEDLEGPVSRAGGVQVLLRLLDTKGKGKEAHDDDLIVDLPLHLRYQTPVVHRSVNGKRADVVAVDVEWPHVFWECPPNNKAIRRCSPSKILSTTFPTLIDVRSSHYHLSPKNSTQSKYHSASCSVPLSPSISLRVPTGVTSDLEFVDVVNFVAIWLGALWIALTAFTSHRNREPAKRKKIKLR